MLIFKGGFWWFWEALFDRGGEEGEMSLVRLERDRSPTFTGCGSSRFSCATHHYVLLLH